MTYGITIATVGNWSFISITPEEFQQIKDARRKLLAALEIEEKFDLFMENYAEYERDVLRIAQRQMLRDDGTWTTAMDDILLLNRRLANLLMAGRLYRDQVRHDIATIYGRRSVKARNIDAAFSRESNGALGYRVIEALRNYVQHEALPIRNLHYGPEKVSSNGRELVRFTLTPELDVAALRVSDFKRSVFAEIEKSAGRSVTVFAREFVTGLTRVQREIRQATEEDMHAWKSAIDGVVSVGREQFHCHIGLAVVARDEFGNHPEIIEIFEDFVQRLVALRKRYLNIGSLTEWFVSSEAV
jgi:hypothetical protein